MGKLRSDIVIETAEVEATAKITPPPEYAAGVPALVKVTQTISDKPGFIKGLRILTQLNQRFGVDCSSCAWPEPEDHRSITEFCENGAKAMADETTLRKIGPRFFAAHSIQELSQQSDYWLNRQGRITEPLILKPGENHYKPIDWEDAFSLIGEHLRELDDPDKAVFYTSGRTSNEAAFLYQLFIRQYGTNNLPDCSNMCHESSGRGLGKTIGIGKGTVKLEDFYEAEVILVVGQNPGTNHPRMLMALEKAVENGAQVVSINPIKEVGLSRFKNPQDFMNPIKGIKTLLSKGKILAQTHIPVKVGGDVALFQTLNKALLELSQEDPSILDMPFIQEKTDGYEELRNHLDTLSWQDLEESCGLSKEELTPLIEMLAKNKKIIVCWAMGITQHPHGVDNVEEIVNLLLLKGSIGKAGAGACPVRGHSNVQGDRTMGIWEHLYEPMRSNLKKHYNFDPPEKVGYDTVASIRAMLEGKVSFFMAMGGNFLSASPDTYQTAQALGNCELTVQVSTKLNRSHLVTGKTALILPCIARSERDRQAEGDQFITVENSMGYVSPSQGRLQPISSHLFSEPAIVANIAKQTLQDKTEVPWDLYIADYSQIRKAIEAVIPGCQDYDRKVKEGGFYLPNGPREGNFPTPSGKAHLTVHPIPSTTLPEGRLLLMTIRSHDQFNTTIYGVDDRYRGIFGQRKILMIHPKDIERYTDKKAGDKVSITSYFQGETRKVEGFTLVEYDLPRGCVAGYFPELNPLVHLENFAKQSHTPASKWVEISLD